MDLAGRIRLGGVVGGLSAALVVSATRWQSIAPVVFGVSLGLGVVALSILFALVAAGAAAVAASLAGTFRVYGGWGLLELVPGLAVTLVAGLLVGWSALRQVARAPRTAEDDDAAGERWRRRTTTTVVAAMGVLASVSVVGAVAAIGSLVGGAIAVLGPVAVLAVLALGWYSMLLIRSDLTTTTSLPEHHALTRET